MNLNDRKSYKASRSNGNKTFDIYINYLNHDEPDYDKSIKDFSEFEIIDAEMVSDETLSDFFIYGKYADPKMLGVDYKICGTVISRITLGNNYDSDLEKFETLNILLDISKKYDYTEDDIGFIVNNPDIRVFHVRDYIKERDTDEIHCVVYYI